ncbi:MAG TPA: hypothetical protein VF469_26840 [Kofleriaceae bacterium]
MSLPFHTPHDELIARLVPFVVAPPFNRLALDLAPFGLPIVDEHVIDPLKLSSEQFLTLLQRLDGLTFGPEGMPMPRWVFYDCAELPAAIFGFALRAADTDPRLAAQYPVPKGYAGLVPVSMWAGLPMFRPGHWFGHNLSSLAPVADRVAPGMSLKGLGSVTKALGMKALRVRRLYGATQWASAALFIHSKFGPLELVTAYTPAHSEAETLTYAFDATDESLRATLGDPKARLARPEPSEWIDAHDTATLMRLQDRIEAGERLCIPTAPRRDGERPFVPVAPLP